jgi:hypothetical protein
MLERDDAFFVKSLYFVDCLEMTQLYLIMRNGI